MSAYEKAREYRSARRRLQQAYKEREEVQKQRFLLLHNKLRSQEPPLTNPPPRPSKKAKDPKRVDLLTTTTPCPDTEPSCFRNVGHWNTASRDIRVNIPHTQEKQPIGLHKDGPTSAKPLPYQENPRLEVHTKGDGRSAIGRRGSNQPSSCVAISALLAALVGILFYGVFGVVFL